MPDLGHLGRAGVPQGAVDGEGGVRQALQVARGVGGLGGPAPLAGRGGVGDGLELPQGVRVTQSARDLVVAVVGCPAVVHGDPGEGREHPGGVHGLAARPGVDGDQRELARRRGVHPGEPARHAEPGLVEVSRIGGGQRAADRLRAAADRPGDPGDHPGHRARRHRDAEQFADRLAGAAAGQELPVPQVRSGRRGRRRPAGDGAAAAAAGDDPVPGHQRPDLLGQVDHLAAPGPGHLSAEQACPAPGAPARLVRDHLVRVVGQLQRHPRAGPSGRPGLRPLLSRCDLGAGLASPPADGGFDEFRGFCRSRARSASTSARSSSSWAWQASTRARSTPTSVPFASITARRRALAARSAATSSGAGGTAGTNHT